MRNINYISRTVFIYRNGFAVCFYKRFIFNCLINSSPCYDVIIIFFNFAISFYIDGIILIAVFICCFRNFCICSVYNFYRIFGNILNNGFTVISNIFQIGICFSVKTGIYIFFDVINSIIDGITVY